MSRRARGSRSVDDESEPFISSDKNDGEAEKQKTCNLSICEKDYPKHVFFIIGNEFCERFCFYGMKAVLQTYLLMQLKLPTDTASSWFHVFTMIAYFTPLLGAVLADSYIGRYWTIVSLSIIYVIGNVVMAATAVNGGYFIGAIIGMLTIAIGTGGIKPCVSAFGADQFPKSMAKAQEAFFSLFYVAINAGALLSQIITPELKETECFGGKCWILAFGLPAILMITALVLFLIGTPFYYRNPVSGDSALKIFKAIFLGIGRAFDRRRRPVEHWLDRAVGNDISQSFVDDCKAMFKVLVVFLPIPFFWALFDQQGSRWILQAQKMDSYVSFADWTMQAEQVQVFNGLLIVLSVPLFEMVIYPLAARCRGFLVKPLQRMVAGSWLCAISFVIIGLIQIAVQQQNDLIVREDISTYRMRVFNFDSKCSYDISSGNKSTVYTAEAGMASGLLPFAWTDQKTIKITSQTKGCDCNKILDLPGMTPISSLTLSNGCSVVLNKSSNSFPDEEEFSLQTLVALYSRDTNVKRMTLVASSGKEIGFMSSLASPSSTVELSYFSVSRPGKYKLLVQFNNNATAAESDIYVLRQGGAYTFTYGLSAPGRMELLVDKSPNVVSVFWQFFPYLVITWGEVMFSITGLSFAFSQAPPTMKSILTAAWLLTVSFGNLIDLIIINLQIYDKALEFFVFAGIMAVVTVIFSIIAYFYKYVDSVYGDGSADRANNAVEEDEGVAESSTSNYGTTIDSRSSAKTQEI